MDNNNNPKNKKMCSSYRTTDFLAVAPTAQDYMLFLAAYHIPISVYAVFGITSEVEEK